jgi:type IV secretion system protein VirB10
MLFRKIVIGALMIGLVQQAFAQASSVSNSTNNENTAVQAVDNGSKSYTVPAGTRVLLSLKHEVSTRVAQVGDPVYLVSEFPVVEQGAVVIPAGIYVKGVIDRVQRPGKVKGRAQLQMHFTSIIFQNGVEIPIPGTLDSIPGSSGASVKNSEGIVEQAGSKGKDAQKIAETTGTGAGVGGLVSLGTGNAGEAVGIGAGAGAAVGILTTLFTRGNDIVFPQGSTVEMELVRPLSIKQEQLAGMPSYTGIAIPQPTDSHQMH